MINDPSCGVVVVTRTLALRDEVFHQEKGRKEVEADMGYLQFLLIHDSNPHNLAAVAVVILPHLIQRFRGVNSSVFALLESKLVLILGFHCRT
ncbi:MAG: hypothetical protein GY703_24940 [Gammaproteobacteria bacterium]|nr:hypothetical protein [Gammaproteobacteria bacterium]